MLMTGIQRRGPGSRADAHHPTRVELLDAAVRVAERDGVDALSVAAVTAEAGHSKGTFYVHFADRTAMLVELHRRFHDDLFELIERNTAGQAPGAPRADARITAFLDGCRAQPGVRSMLLDARAVPEIAEQARQRNAFAAASLADDLRALVPHPQATAVLIVSATVEVALRELVAGRRLPRLRSALRGFIPST
jgi:AcrR family transcriptional regulator